MNYEKNKEALVIVRQMISDGQVSQEVAEKYFPELKESEDERIRKELIEFVKSRLAGFPECDKFIAWLEKQGKNNMGISEATKQELEDNLNKALEKETPESWNEFLKKQGEQKSVPKFKVGDTIAKKHNSDINNFGSFTITDITGGKYWYNDRIICDITEQNEWELYETDRQRRFISGDK